MKKHHPLQTVGVCLLYVRRQLSRLYRHLLRLSPRLDVLLGLTGVSVVLLSVTVSAMIFFGRYYLARPTMAIKNQTGQVVLEINLPLAVVHHPRVHVAGLSGVHLKTERHGISQRLLVYVDDRLAPQHRYPVTLDGIYAARLGMGKITDFQVKTPAKPDITKVTAEEVANGLVKANSRFVITLSDADTYNLLHLKAQVAPNVATQIKRSEADNKVLYAEPVTALPQGAQQQLIIQDLDQPDKPVQTLAFNTAAAPVVTAVGPQDLEAATGTLRLSFKEPMQPASVSVSADGLNLVPHWDDDHTLSLTYGEAQPGKAYPLVLKKGAVTTADGLLRADVAIATLHTTGAIEVSSPQAGRTLEPNTAIRVNFNQVVDKATAEKAFSITPNVDGTLRWEGNVLVFQSTNMNYMSSYTVKLDKTVQPVFGLTMASDRTFKIATVIPTKRLGLPFYRQAYSLSCEEASLRMVLAKKGIFVTDMDIVQRVGYTPTPRDTVTNSWSDPASVFVGDINGTMGVTGWGVYAEPIAKAAQSFGLNAQAYHNVDAKFIAQQVYANKAVIIWGASSSVFPDAWNTLGGVRQAPRNDHTQVIDGVYGPPDNPISFYIHNPLSTTVTYSTNQLNNYLSAYSNAINMVVVIDL